MIVFKVHGTIAAKNADEALKILANYFQNLVEHGIEFEDDDRVVTMSVEAQYPIGAKKWV